MRERPTLTNVIGTLTGRVQHLFDGVKKAVGLIGAFGVGLWFGFRVVRRGIYEERHHEYGSNCRMGYM